MESNNTHEDIPLISWNKVCSPKCEGGLGIRKVQDVNMVLSAKLGWKVVKDPNNLWVRVVFAKYLGKGGFFEVKKSANATRMWKYVLTNRYLLKKGISWCLGNGNKNSFDMIFGWMNHLSLMNIAQLLKKW